MNSPTIRPFGANILVKPVSNKYVLEVSDVSLCEYGEVLAIGEHVSFVKVGDTIGFTKWGVNELTINDEKHYFIPEDFRFILGFIDMSGDMAAQV